MPLEMVKMMSEAPNGCGAISLPARSLAPAKVDTNLRNASLGVDEGACIVHSWSFVVGSWSFHGRCMVDA
jgi:hypothetical protein